MGHWHMVNPQRHFLPFSFKQAPATKWPAHNTGTTHVPCFVTGTLYGFASQMQRFPFRLLVLFTKAHLQVNLCYLFFFFFLRHVPAHQASIQVESCFSQSPYKEKKNRTRSWQKGKFQTE